MKIGVDIGGTNLLVGIVENGKVLKRNHQPIAARSNFDLVSMQVCDAIREIAGNDISSVGISVAGSVDVERGVVLRAQNLDWNDSPLADFVSQELDCKVTIENDVTAAAWGEFKYGAGRCSESMFAVWIGTGIGGGLILDGEVWRGPLGTGGEFGMGISEFNPDSPTRVLESFASRSGFQQMLKHSDVDIKSLAKVYGTDESITNLINAGAERIGTSIANVITLLSLDIVVLGGGLIETLGKDYIQVIRKQFEQDVFPKHCLQCQFKTTELGPDAGLLGATFS
ncbi:MAG: ROK family protein [Phycisphaerales bacterium]|jgi:glucokinase|nr:ROK family protein [Phycisphaerales bacterium]